MNSGDRGSCVITGFIAAAFVAIVFMVSSCTVEEARVNLPNNVLQTKSEHAVKMACIAAKGEMSDYNRCTFNK